MLISGLVKRGEVFYLRRRVPLRLMDVAPKPVLVRSLRTKAYLIAINRHAQLSLELDRLFAIVTTMSKLDPEFAKTYFHQMLRNWMGLKGTLPAPPSNMALIEERMKDEDEDLLDIGTEHFRLSSELQDHLLYPNLYPDDAQLETIGSLLLRTCMEHAKQILAQQSNQYTGQTIDPYFEGALDTSGGDQIGEADVPTSPPEVDGSTPSQQVSIASPVPQVEVSTPTQQVSIPAPIHPVTSSTPPLIDTLENTFASFMLETKYDEKREYRFNRIYATVTELFGKTKPIHEIGPQEVRQIKETLLSFPKNAEKVPAVRNKPMHKQIEIAKKKNLDLLTPETINTYLSSLRLWFGWAKENGYLTDNPFDGAKVKKARKTRSNRHPFKADELKAVFNTPTFTGMDKHSKWRSAGDLVYRDMRYWVPLIGIHTGMRQAEICQLYIGDVQEIDGIWCFCIDEGNGQSLKSEAAIRNIPIHSNLLTTWGFKDWVLARHASASPTDTLFAEVSDKSKGQYATSFSKWFAKFMEAHDLKRPDLVFHSLRHSFADMLRNADIDEATSQVILGHASKTVTARYGSGHYLTTLQRAIEKVKMPFDKPEQKGKQIVDGP